MRLGQLARKLSKRPAEILEVLSIQNVSTEEVANYRLSDEQVNQAYRVFAPELLNIVPEAETEIEEVQEIVEVSNEPTVSSVEAAVEVVEPSSEPAVEEQPGAIELIKAPKVALSGLKVLGKIDLPEPKKKEAPTTEETPESSETPAPAEIQKPRFDNKRKFQRQERQDNRPRKNPIALQREREAREMEQKRKEEEKQKKESRTQYYQQRVKPAAPTKAARIYKDDVEHFDATEQAPPPKTLLGKLWRWFTT